MKPGALAWFYWKDYGDREVYYPVTSYPDGDYDIIMEPFDTAQEAIDRAGEIIDDSGISQLEG